MPNVSDSTTFDCKNAKKIYYPSPFDCQTYYQCVDSNGPPTKFSCSNGLHFNPIIQACDDIESVANVKPECASNSSIALTKSTMISENDKVNSLNCLILQLTNFISVPNILVSS